MRKAILALAACLLATSPALATDGKGDFRVKGYGLQSCQDYRQASAAKDALYLASRSWVNGYVTAYNQINPGTYDIAGQVDLESLMGWLDGYCQQNPGQSFALAVTAMTAALQPQKLAVNPGAAAGQVPGNPEAEKATLKKVQTALKARGFYGGAVDGRFGPGTGRALEAFQRAEGLAINGQPDQATLVRLLN